MKFEIYEESVNALSVPTFLFHHFQFLNQLTHVILVIFVSQPTEITKLTNEEIKILLKIYCSTHQIKKKLIKKNIKIYVHLQQGHQRTQTQVLNIRTHVQIYLHFLALSCQPNTNTNRSPARTQTQTQQQIFSNHKTQIYKIITQTHIFSSFNQQRNLQQIKFINPETKFINPENSA